MKWLIAIAVLGAVCLYHARAQRVCLADIAILVDRSGSICNDEYPRCDPDNWGTIVRFLERIVESLDVGKDKTRLAAVSFAGQGRLEFDLNDYENSNQYKDAMRKINYNGGSTNPYQAMNIARTRVFRQEHGDRSGVPNIVLFITDGKPTVQASQLEPEVRRLQSEGAKVIAVGVTSAVDENLLKSLVVQQNDYIFVQDFNKLAEILDNLISQTCRDISTGRPVVTTPKPTMPPARECKKPVDLAFVLDGSGSIGGTNFNLMKDFVMKEAMDLDVNFDNRNKLALVSYSGDVMRGGDAGFKLDKFFRREECVEAIKKMPIPSSSSTTNTGDALKYLRTDIFGRNGDRNSYPNVAVVLTDGNSQNKLKTIQEANLLKKQGVHVIVIGIGTWMDEEELKAMASWPFAKNFLHLKRFDELPGIRQKLRAMICNNDNECNSNPCRNGGQCEDKIYSYMCKCRSGYGGHNCERTCRQNANVFFAVDASGSVGKKNFQLQSDFVRELVYGLSVHGGSRVGSSTFATKHELYFNLKDYVNDKYKVLNSMNYHYTTGTTDIAEMLEDLRNNRFTSGNGMRDNMPNIALVITDGRSDDSQKTWEAARKLREKNVHILAIGVGPHVHDDELKAIASYPAELNKNYFKVTNFQQISSLRDRILNAMCNNQNECNSNPCRNGGQCTDKINGYVCNCRQGYSGVNCQKTGDGKADIVFNIDVSGSIRNDRFDKVREFLVKIVEQIEKGEDKVRFGAIKFSDNAIEEFFLNTYKYHQDVIAHLKRMKFLGGKTYTASALQKVKADMFSSNRGARNNVPKFLITFTDGNSNVNPQLTLPRAIEIKESGVHMIVMAVGKMLNQLELKGLASIPEEKNLFTVDRFDDLKNQYDNIVNAFTDRSNECQSNPCRNGGRCINGLGRYICQCSRNYAGERCDRRCTRQKDVTLVLDLSGSVDLVSKFVIGFARYLIHGLDIRNSNMKFGLITFQSSAKLMFNLNKYRSSHAAAEAIAFRLAGERKTNTQEALRFVYQNMFSSGNGDRGGVENVAVVVTDGHSNVNPSNTIREATNAKSRGVRLICVGVGDNVNLQELNEIASEPDNDHVFRIERSGQEKEIADKVLDRICQ